MLERMGIIGNTHGVNVSNKPKPKKVASTTQPTPSASVRAIRSCSGNAPADSMALIDAVDGAGPVPARGLTVAAAGIGTDTVFFVGG